MLEDKKLIARFCKDFNLPIKIYDREYFNYFATLYNDYFKVDENMELLKEALSEFEDSTEFLNYYNELQDLIINTIKEKEEYVEFSNADFNKFKVNSKYCVANIYKNTNLGKCFVSIDLNKANFQALHFYNKNIVEKTESYEEFISKFTKFKYFAKSKHFRQVVFGNLNPKRQLKIEQFLIEQIIEFLSSKNILCKDDIVMATKDEVVFEIDENNVPNVKLILDSIKSNLNIDVKVEAFKLNGICGYYVKEDLNSNKYTFSCVPSIYYPQVFKIYHNLEINEKDLTFFYEGNLARFMNPITEVV